MAPVDPVALTRPVDPARGLRTRLAALSPQWRLAALILLTTLGRLWAASAIHLSEDEAYYRLWAQRLHAGYYDHPPMIAWCIRAGLTLVGDDPLGVRLLPVLGCAVTTWLVYDVARLFGAPPDTRWRAAFWYNCTITVGFGGVLATPDAPASVFWIATFWSLAHVIRASTRRAATLGWAAAGAFAGLAALSKYSALFLAPGVLLWLVSDAAGRARLRTPGPWLAIGAAVAVAAPNLVWNAGHGWITLAKQFGRITPEHFAPQHLPEFLLIQALLLNPIVAVYAILGVGDVIRGRSALGRGGPMTALIGAPFAAYLALHALHASVQAHWPVPLYAEAALLAAAAAAERRGLRSWVGLGLAASALALLHLAAPRTDIGRLDPALPLRGWPGFAALVQSRATAMGAGWVGAVSYGTAAQLASEGGALPVLQIDERRRYDDLRPTVGFDSSLPGLVLDLPRRLDAADLARCFRDVREVEALERGAHNGPLERYRAFLVRGPAVALPAQGCVTAKDLRGRRSAARR